MIQFIRKYFGPKPAQGEPRFTWYKSLASGEYYWHLQGPNNETLCQSEGYTSKAGLFNGIEAVRRYACMAPVVERTVESD